MYIAMGQDKILVRCSLDNNPFHLASCQYLSSPFQGVACHVNDFRVGLQFFLFISTASFPQSSVPQCEAHTEGLTSIQMEVNSEQSLSLWFTSKTNLMICSMPTPNHQKICSKGRNYVFSLLESKAQNSAHQQTLTIEKLSAVEGLQLPAP